MPDRALVVTRSPDLYTEIQTMLVEPVDGKALCEIVLPQLKTTTSALDLITANRQPVSLLLLDATVPSTVDTADGESGQSSLALLMELRRRGSDIRVLILLPHRMEDIETHCARSEFHSAMYCRDFAPESLRATLAKLQFGAAPNQSGAAPIVVPSDVAVEIEIGDHLSKLTVIEERGPPTSREVPVPYVNGLSVYADTFRTWRMFETIDDGGRKKSRPVTNWREQLKIAGMPLYDNLVRGVLGEGLLQEYQQRPGGLARVHLRFHIPEKLFTVPFEALYDSVTNNFVRIYVPMARKILATGQVRPSNDNRGSQIQDGLRILFIKAPVDGLLQLVDEAGGTIASNRWFEPLANLDVEERRFKEHIHGKTRKSGKVAVDFFEGGPGSATFADNLRTVLESNRYDVVHFAGHAFTTDAGRTFLVVPSGRPDQLSGLSVSAFARWAGSAGVHFVYLSSCRGGSCRAVQNLAENGVPDVLGFRWDVEDDMAAKFAEVFYEKLLVHDQPIAKAYRDACVLLHDDPARGTSPIWVSPVLIMQNDNWWRRSA